MPPRIIPILDRLRQDIAAELSRETIEEACRQLNAIRDVLSYQRALKTNQ